jgi:hypothetical protein
MAKFGITSDKNPVEWTIGNSSSVGEWNASKGLLYATARGITSLMLERFVRRNGFIAKPYTREQLLTALANLLRQPQPRDR